MSRKTIFTVLGVLGAVGAVVSQEFGLTVQLGTVVAGLASVLVYVFGEMKADFERIGTQADKWKDPKFYLTVLNAILVALSETFGWDQTVVTSIIGLVTIIVGILFKKDSVPLPEA